MPEGAATAGSALLFPGAGTERPDAHRAARDGTGLAGYEGSRDVSFGMRRSQEATEPPTEDRGEEAKERAERDCVPEAIHVDAGCAGEEVSEAVYADAGENSTRGGVA